jgi:hypothetical protein
MPRPNAVPQDAARIPVGPPPGHLCQDALAGAEESAANRPFHLVSRMVLDLVRILVFCLLASAVMAALLLFGEAPLELINEHGTFVVCLAVVCWAVVRFTRKEDRL